MNKADSMFELFEFDRVKIFPLTSRRPLPSGISVRAAFGAFAPEGRLWHHA
jgi:hypothetical protein